MVAHVDVRRLTPRTDAVLADSRLAAAEEKLGRGIVIASVRRAQERARAGEIAPAAVADDAVAGLPPLAATLTPVLNATGVLLHTNLGRAPLSAAARAAVQAAAGSTDIEFDLGSGLRGKRGRGMLAALAAAVPAAEAVHVVNNNAAALVLAATALAAGREIIVSRGELIEIGDGFRLPDLIESTGARIREVGTTNRTTAADYAAAIGPQTAFVLKVHPSNYRIEGFTASASIRDLAGLRRAGRRRHRLRTAASRTRCCPTSRTPPAGSRRAPRSSPPAATSCSAARRPVCCSAGPTWSPPWPGTRWPVRCGSTSSPWRRWRRHLPARRRRSR